MEGAKKRICWMLGLAIFGGGLYILANFLGHVSGANDIQFGFEKNIPFIPEAVFIYLLIFPFLFLPLFLIKKYSEFAAMAAIYGVLVFCSIAVFMQFPTKMERPPVPQGTIGLIFGLIRAVDGPNNLFPSLHVSSVIYAALALGLYRPGAKWPCLILAAIIGISTLFVKQHAIIDVLGGAVFGLAAYFLLCAWRSNRA